MEIKDSGVREEYDSGMVRDTQDGKPSYILLRDGPMLHRWAQQLTGGARKYGRRNWQLANSEQELERFRDSAARHFEQWLNGDTDEDHAAAVFFNINAVEFVKAKMMAELVDAVWVYIMNEDAPEETSNPYCHERCENCETC